MGKWTEAQKRYAKSPKGIEARQKYQMSVKGKERRKAYLEKRKKKLKEARLSKTEVNHDEIKKNTEVKKEIKNKN